MVTTPSPSFPPLLHHTVQNNMALSGGGGGNKISYSLDRPEYEYTTSTTQFDEELMKRDIITFEQAMMAKGASAEEAQRLAHVRKYGEGFADGGAATPAPCRQTTS